MCDFFQASFTTTNIIKNFESKRGGADRRVAAGGTQPCLAWNQNQKLAVAHNVALGKHSSAGTVTVRSIKINCSMFSSSLSLNVSLHLLFAQQVWDADAASRHGLIA